MGESITKVNKLLNLKIDFESIMYSKLIDKLQTTGITFQYKDTDGDFKFLEDFNLGEERIYTYQNMLNNGGIFYFMNKKTKLLRNNIFCPFFSEIFYSDDVISCFKKK